jgi:hypothetical protein
VGEVAGACFCCRFNELTKVVQQLTESQVNSIITFLKALTGEIPTDYIKEPELPKSTAKTPKPDLSD